MPLSEAEFTVLVETGCPCKGELLVRAMLLQKLEQYRGELLGEPTWGYKGEELVRGTFAIECVRCKASLYQSEECSRCGHPAGVTLAEDSESELQAPESCPECAGDKLTLSAFVPGKVVYGDGRSQRARSNVTRDDPGFHLWRVECKSCHHDWTHRGSCVLCGSAP